MSRGPEESGTSTDGLLESMVGVSNSKCDGFPLGGTRREERDDMRNLTIGASLIALVGLAFGGAGCVNNKPGLQLAGIPALEGTAEEGGEVPCDAPVGDPVTEERPVTCSGDADCSGSEVCNADGQCEDMNGQVVTEQIQISCSDGCPSGSACGTGNVCRTIVQSQVSVPSGISCTVPEPGGISQYSNEVRINLPGIKNAGRLGEPGGTVPSDSQICQVYRDNGNSQRAAQQFVRASLGGKGYTIWFEVLNNLEPTENTGLQGQGGGGGGYEGLQLNANDIELRKLRVSFPSASGSGLGKEIDVAGIAASGGGGAVKGVQVFDSRDFQALTELHSNLPGETTQDNDIKTTRMKFRFTGRTIGGTKVESTALEVPLRLCTQGDPCYTPPLCDVQSG